MNITDKKIASVQAMIWRQAVENLLPGARPTNDISIVFEIWSKFHAL